MASIEDKKPDLRVYIGSTVLFMYLVISTIIIAPLVLLCIGSSFSLRYQVAIFWIKCLFFVLRITCNLTYEVKGLENLPKQNGYIVLSKHQSAWETIALRLFLPPQTTLLKKSLLQIPIWGWALSTLKPIAIDRKNQRQALKMLMKQGVQRLNEGMLVVIFPEGTRVAPGEKKKFNAGGAMLAHKTGAPVIPVAHNSGHYWPRYSFLKFPGKIQVRIGPAIKTIGKSAKEINAEAQAWIENAMTEFE